MTDTPAAPDAQQEVLKVVENALGIPHHAYGDNEAACQMQRALELSAAFLRSESAQKLCEDCGCELECVKYGCAKTYAAPSAPDMAALAAAHKAVLNITGIEERSTSARCVGVPPWQSMDTLLVYETRTADPNLTFMNAVEMPKHATGWRIPVAAPHECEFGEHCALHNPMAAAPNSSVVPCHCFTERDKELCLDKNRCVKTCAWRDPSAL